MPLLLAGGWPADPAGFRTGVRIGRAGLCRRDRCHRWCAAGCLGLRTAVSGGAVAETESAGFSFQFGFDRWPRAAPWAPVAGSAGRGTVILKVGSAFILPPTAPATGADGEPVPMARL